MDSRVRKVTWALLGVSISGLVGALLVGVVVVAQIRGTQVTNTVKTDKSAETLAVIKDCTSPSGKCYKRGQDQTAQVLSDVSRIIILAAACAVDVTPAQSVADRQASITNCLTERIARDDR